jgi:hypothetical protein
MFYFALHAIPSGKVQEASPLLSLSALLARSASLPCPLQSPKEIEERGREAKLRKKTGTGEKGAKPKRP